MKHFQFFSVLCGILFIFQFASADTLSFSVFNTAENRFFTPSIKWNEVIVDSAEITYKYAMPSKRELRTLIDSTIKVIDFENNNDQSESGKKDRRYFLQNLKDWLKRPVDCLQSINPTDRLIYNNFFQLIDFAKSGDLYDLQCSLIFNFWPLDPARDDPKRFVPIWSEKQVTTFQASRLEQNTAPSSVAAVKITNTNAATASPAKEQSFATENSVPDTTSNPWGL